MHSIYLKGLLFFWNLTCLDLTIFSKYHVFCVLICRMQSVENLEEMDVVSPLASQTFQSSVNSSKKSYIPQVKNDLIPKINQEFVSLDAVHEFYNDYGKESGFGTREWSSRKNGDIK